MEKTARYHLRLEFGHLFQKPKGRTYMRMKLGLICALALVSMMAGSVSAADPKLDGAYRYVSTTFQGGRQTDAEVKGLLVVHGKHMAFVRANIGRQTWDQNEAAEERTKKIVAAYQGLAATCGEFSIQGNVITLQQLAQSSPASMGTAVKWEYKVEGKMLKLRPVANSGVEFAFEKVE